VIHAVLLWALPDSWTQFDLLAPDFGARIDAEMRRRLEGVVGEADLSQAIALQVENIRSAAEDGVILLATLAQETSGSSEMPPRGLSLTLALANRPPSGEPGTGGPEAAAPRSAETAAFVSEAKPLVLEAPDMTAFTSERRTEMPLAGMDNPISQFQAQVFVLPNDQAGMAVVTVTTFHRDCEDEARKAARTFANTLRFVAADDETETP
jgi:hypothetical protein